MHERVAPSKNIPGPQEVTHESETLLGSIRVESAVGQLSEPTRVLVVSKLARSGLVI